MATYPNIAAGQRVTASLLTSMLPQHVVKQANTDKVNATFGADPELTLPLVANAVYQVEFLLIAGGIATADVQTRWALPATASGQKVVNGPGSTALDTNADNVATRQGVHTFGTAILYNGVRNATASYFRIYEYAVVTLVDAGSITLEWAQGTTQTTASRIAAGSMLRVRRLG
ncbi:hypothetical protein AB0C69_11055 [Actinomadura sp. NPDC048032]|uniref:hypothetical protein n=1 Tax=Actinomadura sp. NPDC048032 TaxID=3155747 RepID=UPI0033F078EF